MSSPSGLLIYAMHVRKRESSLGSTLARLGNLGDVKPVGSGINEMRVHVGAGYRVYFVRRGAIVIVLLCGGDKASQKQDILRAKALLRALDQE